MSEQELILGAAVNLTQQESGQYKAVQQGTAIGIPPTNDETRKSIDWGFGPVKVSGYVDTDRLEIGVNVSVLGISLGTLYGNLQEGVGVDVDLFLAKGEIKFYLKNGNEVWVHLGLQVTFDGSYEGDYKIISL
ncbi:MAG: hypothetical protein Q9201_005923 [Fulgogasparrea decipioides]